MTISNHERVSRALNILGQGLYPYVEQEMQAVHGDRWRTVATSHLPDHQTSKRNVADPLREDVSAQLIVMSKQWDKVFKRNKNLGQGERTLVSELINVRNQWAHQSSISIDDTYRALDRIAILLKAVSAFEQADNVEKQKLEVLRILSQEQTRYETRQGSVVSPGEEKRIRERLDEILKQLPFQQASLLNRALTHRSYLYENPREVSEDNELLEFLGDALLTFLSGEYLYRHYSDKNEGELTDLRSLLVKDRQLARFAADLDIGKWMLLGRGEATSGGKTKQSLLSNTFEAIIGAYFLDSGIEAVRDFVEPLFTLVVEEIISSQPEPDSNILVDPKNRFQEWVQQNIGPIIPQYITIQEAGPDHAKEFTVEVRVNSKVYGQGSGRSKKEAEKRAAGDALKKLRLI
ncbi:ribonuclease III [Microcoleus sp. Pol14C6]|uniref:ribonuclease III n=1 Tax=unclassified Microcoleus TaxID=2642155 RepID=UPI002FD4FE21